MATEESGLPKELKEAIANRKKLGDKKFHSETSLYHLEEQDDREDINKDPGVHNESVNDSSSAEDYAGRRRTMSQPGPASGNQVTAQAARAARMRPTRVMYADDFEKKDTTDRQMSKLTVNTTFNRGGDESGSVTPIGERNNTLSSNYRNGDIKSLNSYRLYTSVNEGRGGTPRKRSVVTMDAQSIRSVETHAPPPTTREDNKRMTTEYITLILSSMYAILLVTLGIIIYLSDPIVGDMTMSPIYNIILCGLGFIYHIYLFFDISRYKSAALKNQKIRGLHEDKLAAYFKKQEEDFETTTPGDRTPEAFNRPATIIPPAGLIPVKHDYCFSQGRHSGSFYLKLGAAAFAMGNLVHSVLLIALQVGYLVDDDINNEDCVKLVQVVLDVFNPVYCFVQLYFIFKYSNVIILKCQGLARFAFMHMIGSSLCFWISAIVRETMLALTLYASSRGNYSDDTEYLANVATTSAMSDIQPHFFEVDILYNENCTGSTALFSILENFSPYLYPFSVEFNILIVAVYYIIWNNIGNCENEDNNGSEENSTLDDTNTICKIPTANEENDFTSNLVIYADCHASNRGLFLGLITMVIVVGMLIIGFVFSSVGETQYLELGYLLNNCTKLGLHVAMLVAVVFAYNQTRKLDINVHPVSLLDDILLFICLPAFFMETVFSMIATVNILNVVASVDFMVMVIQVIVQTTMLIDGLRRCSNSRKLRRSKPGRELLMFLLIANVGMWLFNTFSYKSPESLDERYTFYGKVVWSILGHVTLPLIMFYRFHSSVCFADMWDSAYKPGSEH